MIRSDFQERYSWEPFQLPPDYASTEKKFQYSITGFIINIVIVLFWLFVLAFCFKQATSKGIKRSELLHIVPFVIVTLNLLTFHLYAMIDPEYTNKKEYLERLNLVTALKNHWAIISGTGLFGLLVGYFGLMISYGSILQRHRLFTIFVIIVWAATYAVAGMICWGFVTHNRKSILARIIRPWQV